MPDRMSNIVLFETEEEVKAYKKNFQIWRNTALKINRESL